MKFTFPPESRPLDGFTLKRAIYRGGFGEVYYGLSDAGREVALKLLQHNTDVELRGVQQCLNLSHPNLVTIFDVRQDGDGDHWIVMEYVAGETLEAAIRRYPDGMPVETVRKWLPGIAAGVGYLHRCGLVHRDLKPANVFMEEDVVKVGDVGLSKFISPSRQSAHTQSVGTVYYMAPEVAKGRYGKEVDVYALGVILYEMLTGDLPFDGESTGEILMKHLTEQPDLSKLPPRLREVIGKSLHKDAGERYPSMEAFLKSFDQAVLGRSETPRIFRSSNIPTMQVTPDPSLQAAQWHPVRKGILIVLWLIVCLFLVDAVDSDHPLILFVIIFTLGLWSTRRITRSAQEPRGQLCKPTQRPIPRQIARPVVSNTSRRSNKKRPMEIREAFSTSALMVPITGLLAALLAGLRPSLFRIPDAIQADPGMLGLFVAGAVLAAWGWTLIPAIVSTVQKSDRKPVSRWWYALAGGIIGLIAWDVSLYLLVDFPTGGEFAAKSVLKQFGDHQLITTDGQPTQAGFIVYFAAMGLFINWRKLTSPTREKRFRLWSALGAVFIAWLVTRFVPFPFAWALAWPAVIACSVQLASPCEEARSSQV